MARTIEVIKTEITDAWMRNESLQAAYGWDDNQQFSSFYSKVSLENLICYIIAVAIWTHEKLFDTHTQEVENYIAQMKPHSLRWYVNKVKEFRAGQALIDGTDQYDDTNLTNGQIEESKVVKFAAATESAATIYIKVATEENGGKAPLGEEMLDGLKAYIAEIKDAGVRVDIISEIGSALRLELLIYYNPMVLNSSGENLVTGLKPINQAVQSYIENLPFNGEFRTDHLIDILQQVDGVEIPEIVSVSDSYDDINFSPIRGRSIPYAGYYAYNDEYITIEYRPYGTDAN